MTKIYIDNIVKEKSSDFYVGNFRIDIHNRPRYEETISDKLLFTNKSSKMSLYRTSIRCPTCNKKKGVMVKNMKPIYDDNTMHTHTCCICYCDIPYIDINVLECGHLICNNCSINIIDSRDNYTRLKIMNYSVNKHICKMGCNSDTCTYSILFDTKLYLDEDDKVSICSRCEQRKISFRISSCGHFVCDECAEEAVMNYKDEYMSAIFNKIPIRHKIRLKIVKNKINYNKIELECRRINTMLKEHCSISSIYIPEIIKQINKFIQYKIFTMMVKFDQGHTKWDNVYRSICLYHHNMYCIPFYYVKIHLMNKCIELSDEKLGETIYLVWYEQTMTINQNKYLIRSIEKHNNNYLYTVNFIDYLNDKKIYNETVKHFKNEDNDEEEIELVD